MSCTVCPTTGPPGPVGDSYASTLLSVSNPDPISVDADSQLVNWNVDVDVGGNFNVGTSSYVVPSNGTYEIRVNVGYTLAGSVGLQIATTPYFEIDASVTGALTANYIQSQATTGTLSIPLIAGSVQASGYFTLVAGESITLGYKFSLSPAYATSMDFRLLQPAGPGNPIATSLTVFRQY